jgi:regulator of sigma E protease
MSYLLAFLGFIALIILHEAGHFVAAKATGMRVEKFSLFFPPTVVKVRRGETEYALGSLPLGGYVKITGMNPNEEIPDEVRPRAYYNQAVWKRVVTIAAGPAVNILIAFAIVWGLLAFNGQTSTTPNTRVAAIEQSTAASRRPLLPWSSGATGGSPTCWSGLVTAHRPSGC